MSKKHKKRTTEKREMEPKDTKRITGGTTGLASGGYGATKGKDITFESDHKGGYKVYQARKDDP